MNILISLTMIVIVPLILARLFSIAPGGASALIAATFLLEYSAPVVGLAAGLSPVYIIVTVVLVAGAVIYLQFSLFDAMSTCSGRISGFLEWIRGRYATSVLIQRYGVLALVPATLVVGFYICPAISWLFGWDRKTSFLIMISAYSLAATGVLLTGLGIIRWIS